ncbi:MAG: malate synthase G [Hyphomicrobiaceae bacterium]
MDYVSKGRLSVAKVLADFIDQEALPGTGVDGATFWAGLERMIGALAPENRALLAKRDALQAEIDAWHRAHRGEPHDPAAYRDFLERIGYLVPEGPDFTIDTTGVDDEIASMAGPQLVVPVSNARMALNAANARWGSLYDALYVSDAIPEDGGAERGAAYNPVRGARVVARVRDWLDAFLPIENVNGPRSHGEVLAYTIEVGTLLIEVGADQPRAYLSDSAQFLGYQGDPLNPSTILFEHNGLGIELRFDRTSPVGAAHLAGLADVHVEAALTTIIDFEDATAAVDPDDKVACYRNWLGLMKGTLEASIETPSGSMIRRLAPDRVYRLPDFGEAAVPGRSLMLVRNVGHLMSDASVRDGDGAAAPEGILDALVTSLIAMHDLKGSGPFKNSRENAIYIVKPKMHGPEEVAFADRLFAMTEDVLGLPRYTLKMGLMDEERRTSANLKACIRAARSRVFFINTGFLDRTGDEIHTCMEVGPMVRKSEMRTARWIKAYEDRNVEIGIACGLPGRAQIGKGMWAKPDMMSAMLAEKIAHPEAGASTAWVPSPIAATLHAVHYHLVDVAARQAEVASRPRASLSDLLTPPLADHPRWSAAEIQRELDNNAQGILGYVVRWIDQGIGCSKVPDIDNVALMEDRATLRISSQHIANWLHHGIVSEAQVVETMQRMAAVVDRQNAGDPAYRPMAPDFDRSIAFAAALDLVLKGRVQPNGYTEPILHARRLEAKARDRSAG